MIAQNPLLELGTRLLLDEMIDLQIYRSSSTCMDTAMPAGLQQLLRI